MPAQPHQKNRHIWKRGTPPTSIKSLNASVAGTIPLANAAISRSLAAFTRKLLGVDKFNKIYPMAPTPEELQQLPQLTQDEIMLDQLVFASDLTSATATSNNTDMIEIVNKFMAELQKYNIHRFTFAWDLPDSHHWNRTMAVFVAKHWRYEQRRGAFKHYGINQSHNTKSNCISLILRWRGRKRRVLCEYRQDTVKRHLQVDPLLIIPDADCCSDTEWYPDQVKFKRVGLKWRSQQYEGIIRQIDGLSFSYKSSVDTPALAMNRFDQCRIPGTSINPKAAVCCGLPENCYNAVFLAGLTYEQRESLNMKPVIDLDALSEEIKNLVVSSK
ncbi:uncharacterized protein MELLADRAFT_89355 [Melampsora larici-populina 98AG31]|uniref:Uncharacterized protein n=1 Tax=Melampsora larici-populina (strain 98AG31 / pathotype 3-4-7) TaxID=747676 RepID=F4R5V1_MELLP|nr:uncharacterized protein MELLADRAFT_89355 [Melampsora larici-populina 98AG31]EGG12189.1 hypothetical protein MELLADRAFT_89355 [Melampsora larici-populina 98AG31]